MRTSLLCVLFNEPIAMRLCKRVYSGVSFVFKYSVLQALILLGFSHSCPCVYFYSLLIQIFYNKMILKTDNYFIMVNMIFTNGMKVNVRTNFKINCNGLLVCFLTYWDFQRDDPKGSKKMVFRCETHNKLILTIV